MSQTGIEVFRDLNINSDQVTLDVIRASFLSAQTDEWVHDDEQEAKLRRHSVLEGDVLVFLYDGSIHPKSTLTLWQRDNSYRVTNIVPAEVGQLDAKQYNELLMDFVSKVVNRSNQREALNLGLTDDIRSLDSWTSESAARALSSFSSLANKSTTNSHPSDNQRWEEFVILAHHSKDKLPVYILMQWLVEVDGWDETSASKLAIDYEQGISLLDAYDTVLGG